MTGEILVSDVELAKKWLSAGRLDAEIISALEHRGIAKEKSAQLLAELKSGRTVVGADFSVMGNAVKRIASQPRENDEAGKSRASDASAEKSGSRKSASQRSSALRQSSERPRRGSSGGGRRTFPLVPLLIFLLVALGGYFGWRHFQRQKQNANTSGAEAGDRSFPSAKRPGSAKTEPLVAEIAVTGLKLDGVLVNRSNVLEIVRRYYGAASRTNVVESKISYVYDPQGILLFCPQQGLCDSILFDYEGKGGSAGATHPFKGIIQVNNETIDSNTDSATLLGMKSLGLRQNEPSEKIFKADHGSVELYFAYFGTSSRLSLTEITLK